MGQDLDALQRNGEALFNGRRYEEALAAFEGAIQLAPTNFRAWYGKGVVLLALERWTVALEAFNRATDLHPNDFASWVNKGNSLFRLGRCEEALQSWERALELDPRNPVVWRNRIVLLQQSSRHEEVLQCCRRLIALDPGDTAARIAEGDSLLKLGRYDQALECCDSAIALNAANPTLWHFKGRTLLSLGRWEEAVRALNRCCELGKPDANLWSNLGAALLRLYRFEEALRAFDRAIELAPAHTDAWTNKAAAFLESERFHEALLASERHIELDPADTRGWFNRGTALLKLGRLDEALSACERSIALCSTNVEAWINKANALSRLGRLQDALNCCDHALTLDQRNAAAWLCKSGLLLEARRLADALAAAERSVELSASNAAAWDAKAASLIALRRWDDAIAASDRSIALHKRGANGWLNKADALLGLRRWPDALVASEHSIQLDPGKAVAWLAKGVAFLGLRQPDQALSACQRATELDPASALAFAYSGAALLLLDRYDESLRACEHAISLDYDQALPWHIKAQALLSLNRQPEANASFNRYVKLSEDAPMDHDVLQRLLKYYGTVADAPLMVLRLLRQHVSCDAFLRWIRMHERLIGNYTEVLQAMERLRGRPEVTPAEKAKGLGLLHFYLGDPIAAHELFSSFCDSNEVFFQYYTVRSGRAFLDHELKDVWQRAIKLAAERARGAATSSPEDAYYAGLLLLDDEQFELARQCFRHAVKLNYGPALFMEVVALNRVAQRDKGSLEERDLAIAKILESERRSGDPREALFSSTSLSLGGIELDPSSSSWLAAIIRHANTVEISEGLLCILEYLELHPKNGAFLEQWKSPRAMEIWNFVHSLDHCALPRSSAEEARLRERLMDRVSNKVLLELDCASDSDGTKDLLADWLQQPNGRFASSRDIARDLIVYSLLRGRLAPDRAALLCFFAECQRRMAESEAQRAKVKEVAERALVVAFVGCVSPLLGKTVASAVITAVVLEMAKSLWVSQRSGASQGSGVMESFNRFEQVYIERIEALGLVDDLQRFLPVADILDRIVEANDRREVGSDEA